MRSMNNYLKILTIIFVILSSVSCNKKMLPNKLTIGSYYGEGDSLLFISEYNGFFKKNGINVEIKKYESGAKAIGDVINDKIDISGCSEAAFVARSFDDPSLRVITVYSIIESQKIITLSDSGITNANDLKGKKIGVTKGSSSEIAMAIYLSMNDINLSSIKIVFVNPDDYLNAIKLKNIDAIVTWEPHIYNIKREFNNNIIDLSGKEMPKIIMLLNAKNEIIQQKHKEIAALLKSLKEAEDYVKSNNDESKKIVKEKINVTDDYINYAWENILISLNLSQDLIFAMENTAIWRINNNMTNNKIIPNYVKYIYFDALESVKPDSITIIK
jgi:ABC-type nitrate/sulfonate/bicarbonate transport system substrate-binding protein